MGRRIALQKGVRLEAILKNPPQGADHCGKFTIRSAVREKSRLHGNRRGRLVRTALIGARRRLHLYAVIKSSMEDIPVSEDNPELFRIANGLGAT